MTADRPVTLFGTGALTPMPTENGRFVYHFHLKRRLISHSNNLIIIIPCLIKNTYHVQIRRATPTKDFRSTRHKENAERLPEVQDRGS